ncbi:MAG: NUDIX domain-containing protein [Gemmatimonadetes bacterium]|nr:NUDIX domain-containing protein [Gemmatimonadota bacterium]
MAARSARRHAAGETVVRAGVVDVFVVRPAGRAWQHLALRRAHGVRCPGTWEAVHGRIERGETPPQAARREVREETGLDIERLYALTVNPFFMKSTGTVELAVVFVAVVGDDAVTTGEEHDAHQWLSRAAAARRYHWPREREALGHIAVLFKGGNAGKAEDALLIEGRR